jgi:hypothetical protein
MTTIIIDRPHISISIIIIITWLVVIMVNRLELVLEEVDRRAAREQQASDLLTKFRKTTLRRLQELQDRARAEADPEILGGY